MAGTSTLTALDMDHDGNPEVTVGSAILNGADGTIRGQGTRGIGAAPYGGTGSSTYGALSVPIDLDGDGLEELVTGNAAYNIDGSIKWETDGTEVWELTYAGNLGAPAVDDLDADGAPDIDGYPEVLYADEGSIQFFSGLDGALKFRSNEHGSYTILETPIVADVDNDDQVEIVLGHCSWNRSLSVYGDADESWPPGRKVWNQHAYQITNVGDLGNIPTNGGPNWPEYNSFRSGDAGRPPGEWYDVQAEVFDVCEKECSNDKVFVGAWVINTGNLEAPAGVPISITAGPRGEVLGTQYTSDIIAPGEIGEALVFEVSSGALGAAKPVAKADFDAGGAGVLYECDELNNLDDWGASTCNE
ncbi:MAG: hypothetical protein Q8P18_15785 [Pseudomonadota bacterium]|nr:hypothetical protein [Pseudomonadota bacterium]